MLLLLADAQAKDLGVRCTATTRRSPVRRLVTLATSGHVTSSGSRIMDVHKLWLARRNFTTNSRSGLEMGMGTTDLALWQPPGTGAPRPDRDVPTPRRWLRHPGTPRPALEHDEVGMREMADSGFGAFLEATTDAASTTALGPPRRPRRGCASTSWTSDSACLMPSLRHTVWVFRLVAGLATPPRPLCRHYRLASRHG